MEQRRPQFGNRFLVDPDSVFEHNAWDNVEWGEEQEAEAKLAVQQNSARLVDSDVAGQLETAAADYWDKFYDIHKNRFFKDRNWLFTEFPELCPSEPGDHDSNTKKILEVGCGVGNTVFPILEANRTSNVFVYCCDFSSKAVELVKSHESYDAKRCSAFIWDITQADRIPVEKNSLDVILLIFLLSAIHPERMQLAIQNLALYLKPGGSLLLRDYGRFDMAQLRFKNGKCLSDNFYVRGDGTRVYFFTQDELDELLKKANLRKEQNFVDRRLLVNRGRQLKMYRVWIQCKYTKL